MGVKKYEAKGRFFWMIDEWITQPNGDLKRFRKKRIPTREQAMSYAAKVKASAFEGRFFDVIRPSALTVADVWKAYESKAVRDNHAWQTDSGRAVHLLRHLGSRKAALLSLLDVETFRTHRLSEMTQRKTAPSPATLDREVELLKRILNYAVERKELTSNPLAHVRLLRKPNVRRRVLDDADFAKLFDASEEVLKPIVLMAYETGMRLGEILDLTWGQVRLRDGEIHLAPQDTKAEDARLIVLTERLREVISARPQGLPSTPVFPNPTTGKPWQDIRKPFARAVEAAGLPPGLWFHDLRRSFVTRARRLGVAESVVMKMSGHRTRAVFDRYNVVSTADQREAVSRLDGSWTRFGHSGERDTLETKKAPAN